MIKKLVKKLVKSLLPFNFYEKQDVEDYVSHDWDDQYISGRWDYLDQLPELAHYSVIAGYFQHLFPDGKILDVGCGEGVLQQRLSLLQYKLYTGIDMSDIAIDRANKKYSDDRTEFFAADASEYTDSNKYDIIVFNESLYCFNDAVAILNHYKNMLSQDGLFVISMYVQDVSDYHWREIEKHFKIVDMVRITNSDDISWKIGLVKPV